MPIYHVAVRDRWVVAQARGAYTPADFSRELFVHCATAAQLPGVLSRYFTGRTDIVVLTIDTERLAVPVRFEAPQSPVSGAIDVASAERFPHVYGAIPLEAVIAVEEVATG